jgi:type VI secretion system protein ImpA
MDIEQWLSETVDDPPCGPDLEYDNEFLAFDQLSRGKPEQQYGDTVIPAEDPDWRAVDRAAGSLLQRSKDFRVTTTLARAWTRLRGIEGFADGLALNHALLERYWESVHPRLEIDGEHDPVPRANALGILGSSDGLLRDLRAATLLALPGAPMLVRDAEAILTGSAQGEEQMTRGQLSAMLGNAHASGNPELTALLQAQQSLNAIRAICLDRLGPESAPDLEALANLLNLISQSIQGNQAPDTADDADGQAGEASGDSGQAAAGGAAISGSIRSRDDAYRVLGLVCEYLERHEPTNPAPLLIRRAQRMMTMDFMSIINELAPDSMGQIEVVTGTRREY